MSRGPSIILKLKKIRGQKKWDELDPDVDTPKPEVPSASLEWDIIEKRVILPKDYVELQHRIATAFPTHCKVLAVEWPDGSTVSPSDAIFEEGDTVVLREFNQSGPDCDDYLNLRDPTYAPYFHAKFDQEHELSLRNLHQLWNDTERGFNDFSVQSRPR